MIKKADGKGPLACGGGTVDCPLQPSMVKGLTIKKQKERAHEELSQGIMVQHSHEAGFCEYYAAGGRVPEGEWSKRRAGPDKYKAYTLYPKIVPFNLKGEILAKHSFRMKKLLPEGVATNVSR